jgi:putative ABC transport system permease protein
MHADRLFRQFILRHLLQERTRTITTIAGVALGVGVVIAIQLTNASSVRGFETALETVAGRATIEIVGPAGIDETLLPSLLWLGDIGALSPVIEGEAAIVRRDETRTARRAEALKVLGVDILRDVSLRDYLVSEVADRPGDGTLTQQQFLEVLTSPQSIVITEKLARRRSLEVGSKVQLMAGDRVGTYVVRALLADAGPARVMDGLRPARNNRSSRCAAGRRRHD